MCFAKTFLLENIMSKKLYFEGLDSFPHLVRVAPRNIPDKGVTVAYHICAAETVLNITKAEGTPKAPSHYEAITATSLRIAEAISSKRNPTTFGDVVKALKCSGLLNFIEKARSHFLISIARPANYGQKHLEFVGLVVDAAIALGSNDIINILSKITQEARLRRAYTRFLGVGVTATAAYSRFNVGQAT